MTAPNVFKLPVFAPADLFPMMDEEELRQLAEDIAKNGMREPVIVAEVSGEHMLIDGRNRRAACQLAGVEPTVEQLPTGQDPTSYILSVNIHRRHMTKGQRAMLIAKLFPNGQDGPRQDPAKRSLEASDVSAQRLRSARFVLRYASESVENVIAGAISLDAAVEEARNRKAAAESEEFKFAELRDKASDLADLVAEERMSLAEALAANAEREAQRASEIRVTTRNLESVLTYLTSESETLTPADMAVGYEDVLAGFDPAKLDYAAETLSLIAQNRRSHHG